MPVDCVLPRFVCCLGHFLNVQLGRGSVFVIKGFEVEVVVPMTASRQASKGRFGRRPAVTASCIIAWILGLTAIRAPRCAGAAMSRALLCPIPDWPALSVACVKLCSVKPKMKLPASHALTRGQRRRKSKRTRVEGGGPSQRGFPLSEP